MKICSTITWQLSAICRMHSWRWIAFQKVLNWPTSIGCALEVLIFMLSNVLFVTTFQIMQVVSILITDLCLYDFGFPFFVITVCIQKNTHSIKSCWPKNSSNLKPALYKILFGFYYYGILFLFSDHLFFFYFYGIS